jgi:hypothetical protein
MVPVSGVWLLLALWLGARYRALREAARGDRRVGAGVAEPAGRERA